MFTQDVDDDAPTVWRTLQSTGCMAESYDVLSDDDRRIVDKWRCQRESLIRKSVQQAVEANLEEEDDGSLYRESTPFVSVLVKSVPDVACGGALLTVWNITDTQLALLKEGDIIKFRNIAVKATKHEGLVQLSARETTPMHGTVYSNEVLTNMGFVRRSPVQLFHHHAISRKLSLGVTVPIQSQQLDIAGFVLKVVQQGPHQHRIYLADESGLISRIDRNGSAEVAGILSSVSENPLENLQPIAFRDVRVMPYDYVENCAVAAFTHNSTFSTRNCFGRLSAMDEECDDAMVACAATALQAGTTIHAISAKDISPVTVAVGRIVGCKHTTTESTSFEIQVDCGSSSLQTWELPFFLIDDALTVVGDECEMVSLPPDKSKACDTRRALQKILMSGGLLLRFVLQEKKKSYEVRQLSAADGHTIAALHSAVQKVAGQRLPRK